MENLSLIEYLKSSIEILLSIKNEETSSKPKSNLSSYFLNDPEDSTISKHPIPKLYEDLLQKLECDIRTHIALEN